MRQTRTFTTFGLPRLFSAMLFLGLAFLAGPVFGQDRAKATSLSDRNAIDVRLGLALQPLAEKAYVDLNPNAFVENGTRPNILDIAFHIESQAILSSTETPLVAPLFKKTVLFRYDEKAESYRPIGNVPEYRGPFRN